MKYAGLFLAGALLGFFGGEDGGVWAADVYGGSTKDGPSPVYAEKAPIWSGIYVGIHGGYGNANHEVALDFDYEKGDSFELFGLDGINSRGGLLGVNVGADWQVNRFVVGPLAGYTFTGMESELRIANSAIKGKLEKQDEWYVGARGGYLINPQVLAYIGAAFVQTEYEASASIGGRGIGSISKDYDGIKVLAGLEAALGGGWYLKGEYQHDFYDTVTWFDDDGVKISDDLDEDKVLVGVSYKFGLGDTLR